MTFDTPGTAPSIVYPIRGGGDIPAFPPSYSSSSNSPNATKLTKVEILNAGAEELDPTKAPLFSRIFYEKGASINRMIYTLLGKEEWYNSLGTELSRHLWQNPTVEDMMRSFESSFTKLGLPSAMDSMLPWLRRPGYPVITLSIDGTVLKATQQPMSKYLTNQDPWWVPLQISTDNDGDSLLAFNTTSITKQFETVPTSVIGDAKFWGFFAVRYETNEMWEERMLSAVIQHVLTPDYSRALIFQLTLMVTMSHELSNRLTEMLVAIAPTLASNPKLGGWKGEGALYTMIMERAVPIVTILGVCGAPCIDSFTQLTDVLREMTGDLSKRLTTLGTVVSMHSSNEKQMHSTATVPWPTSEDSGVEERDRAVLRPVAMLQAVVYNDTSTVEQSLAMFHSSLHNNTNVPATLARAVYFAAAKYGTASDYTSLLKVIHSLLNSKQVVPLIFGISAAATSTQCKQALHWISGPKQLTVWTASDRWAAYVDMLTYSYECRDAVETAVIDFAQISWNADGENATNEIVKCLNLCASTKTMLLVKMLLEKNAQYITPTETAAVMVNININIDMTNNNKK